MNFLKVVEQVRNFKIFNDKLILKKTDGALFKEDIQFFFKGSPYCVLQNECFCDVFDDFVEIYDFAFNRLITIKKKGIEAAGKIANSTYFTVDWEDENGNEYVSIYNGNKEVKVEGVIFCNYLNSEYKIVFNGYKRKSLTIYSDVISDTILWHYELPEGYTIFGSIQLVENVLFFNAYKDLNRYKKKIGIDVKTGKVLWEHNFEIPYKKNNIADTLNKDNNLCYGYLAKKYQVFNPVTGEMILEKDMSSYYEQGVSPDKNAIYDNKLWFVSGKGENVKFGAVNLETSEVEFVQDFPLNTAEQNDEHFDTPVYHNGKLYLRGVHYNTLYIFEDENLTS